MDQSTGEMTKIWYLLFSIICGFCLLVASSIFLIYYVAHLLIYNQNDIDDICYFSEVACLAWYLLFWHKSFVLERNNLRRLSEMNF